MDFGKVEIGPFPAPSGIHTIVLLANPIVLRLSANNEHRSLSERLNYSSEQNPPSFRLTARDSSQVAVTSDRITRRRTVIIFF